MNYEDFATLLSKKYFLKKKKKETQKRSIFPVFKYTLRNL